MKKLILIALIVLCVMIALDPLTSRADDDKRALQGSWAAHSIETDGKAAPADDVKRMRFTFKKDKLLIRGNFDDEPEEECSFEIDSGRSPKQLDFTPPKEEKPVLAIYELKEDELRICLRHGLTSEGRPTKFATKTNSMLVLIVLKRQKPK